MTIKTWLTLRIFWWFLAVLYWMYIIIDAILVFSWLGIILGVIFAVLIVILTIRDIKELAYWEEVDNE